MRRLAITLVLAVLLAPVAAQAAPSPERNKNAVVINTSCGTVVVTGAVGHLEGSTTVGVLQSLTILDPDGNVVFRKINPGFETHSLGTTCTWEEDGFTFIGTVLIAPPAGG